MSLYASLNPPTSLGEAIAPLAIISDEGCDLIQSLVRSDRSFSPRKDEIKILSDRLEISQDNVEYMFIALSALYNHINFEENKEIEYENVLEETVEELGEAAHWDDEIKISIKNRLKPLLVRNELHATYRKIERLRAGFQPHAIGFSSLAELRPRYIGQSEPELSIDGFVPVYQFRVTTDASDDKQHTFQLTETAFEEFKKAVNRLEQKIRLLKQAGGSNIKIIDL